jgi:uncharacterized membrane protein (DUF373 family)
MAVEQSKTMRPARRIIVEGLSMVENIVYLSLGWLLAVSALALLWYGFRSLMRALMARSLGGEIVGLLDQILLVLLVVELLYTVQVSVREHGLVAEPFLVVALIAVIRRILILTAEFQRLPQANDTVFRHALMELGLLTIMVVALVGSLIVLQRRLPSSA